jgi:hypothetical protein
MSMSSPFPCQTGGGNADGLRKIHVSHSHDGQAVDLTDLLSIRGNEQSPAQYFA